MSEHPEMRRIKSKDVGCFRPRSSGQELWARIPKMNNDVDKMIQPLDFRAGIGRI